MNLRGLKAPITVSHTRVNCESGFDAGGGRGAQRSNCIQVSPCLLLLAASSRARSPVDEALPSQILPSSQALSVGQPWGPEKASQLPAGRRADSGLDTCPSTPKLLEKQTSRSPQITQGKGTPKCGRETSVVYAAQGRWWRRHLHPFLARCFGDAGSHPCGRPSLSSPHRGQTRGEGDASIRTRG